MRFAAQAALVSAAGAIAGAADTGLGVFLTIGIISFTAGYIHR